MVLKGWRLVVGVGVLGGLVAAALLMYAYLVPRMSEFHDDFDSGTIDARKWQIDSKGRCEMDISEAVTRDGNPSLRFRSGAGARCEVVPRVYTGPLGPYLREPYHHERWYAFSIHPESPWRAEPRNEVFAQWHATGDRFLREPGGRGPVLAFRIEEDYVFITRGSDSNLVSVGGGVARDRIWYGRLVPDKWMDWIVQVKWSHRDDRGLLRIWLNDELIVERFGPNSYNDVRGNYLKLGSYHPHTDRVTYLDRVYVGNEDPRTAFERWRGFAEK